ncbi:Domain of unkown function [Micromonospora rhizosphaerae]|uniref:Domain of unkown function n=1 Tax=Micromonospora rhizosphaerae TaxID=568872 RepID=A0A1C6S0E3_9ACTN|nr:Domain of unkown function [Micromonospora rhizosphaerae]
MAAVAGVATALVLAAPAIAHVQVKADNPQAGARDVTITFTGEAESPRAGIKSERVVLPPGIGPQDVRLAKAPTDWKLSLIPDGFTVAGPALKVGQDAVWAVTVAQLPSNATELPFKTLETYSDGTVARWIEIPETGKPEPANPAPVLKLKPPAAVPTGASPTPTSAASTPGSPAPSATHRPTSGNAIGSNVLWILLIVVVVALAAIVASVRWRRRSRS